MRYLSAEEEARLRKVIAEDWPEHMPELDLALHTGLRLSEMYGLTWGNVNLAGWILTIPHSKNGERRYLRLNSVATAARVTLAGGETALAVCFAMPRESRSAGRAIGSSALSARRALRASTGTIAGTRSPAALSWPERICGPHRTPSDTRACYDGALFAPLAKLPARRSGEAGSRHASGPLCRTN